MKKLKKGFSLIITLICLYSSARAQAPIITPDSVNNISCFGLSDGDIYISVVGGTPPYTCIWSNGATTQDISNIPAGTYSIIVFDNVLASDTEVFNITEPAQLNVSFSTTTNVSCSGGNDGMLCANVTGGTAPYDFAWSNGTTTQCITNLSAGTYTITVTDANACTASIAGTITEPPPLTITTPSNVTICQGTDLCVAVTGGTPPYTYFWTPGNITTPCLNSPVQGSYNVTITDANNCTVSTAFTLTVAPLPIIDWTSVNTIYCNGMPAQSLCPNILSGTPPYIYSWSTGEITACATVISQGTYTLVVADVNGCTANGTYSVGNSGGLFVNAGIDTLASCGLCNGAATVSVNGVPPPYSFAWYPPGGITQGGSPYNYSGFCADTLYAVEVYDMSISAHGCATVQFPSACNYYPFPINDAQWSIEYGYYGIPGQICTATWHYGISGDTIIGSDTYQKIYLSQCDSSFDLGCANYFAAIREDASHKIYLRWQNEISDRVLYDFNLNVGDSFYFDLPNYPNQQMYKPVINVDSILINGSYRKRISFMGYTMVQEDWIEGIGCTAGLFETNDFIGNLYYNLRCMTDNGTQLIGTAGNCYCDNASLADEVWPGDANYDGSATNLDLLAIGIGYGSTGPVRPGASLTWVAQPAPDWNDSLITNVNYKHVDCNGDGIINDADTVAIILNYGQTHPLRLLPTPQSLPAPNLYFDITVDTAGTSQQVEVPLMFGTSALPADSIYGLAFTVNYDTSLVKADSVGIVFDSCWIGTIGTNMITLQHNDPLNGQLHVGMTRIDHNNVSGFGQIARVTVVTVDNVSGRMTSVSLFDTLTFSLSDVVVIDKDETIRNVNLSSGSLIVEDSTTHIQEILSPGKIKIYPNPVKDKLFVQMPPGYFVTEISIANVVGEKMDNDFSARNNLVQIANLKSFPGGIYFLKIKTDNGTVVKKFSVIK